MTGEELFSVFLAANEDAQEQMGVRAGESPWAGSAFEWIMRLPSRSRGKAGELLATSWVSRLGYRVDPPRSTEHDRLIEEEPIEIKFSTLWAGGEYVFQQLRDQDYAYALLLGISPTIASAWFVPKSIAFGQAVPQHGGSRGTDTRWLRFQASDPPSWLEAHGGSLEDCANALEQALRSPSS